MTKQSVIYEVSLIENKCRHPMASEDYYLVYIEAFDGAFVPALLTRHEVSLAMGRGEKNPEDCPPYKKSALVKFLEFLRIR